MSISTVLKERRKKLNYTLLDIANKVGVSEATVQRWESGNIKNLRHSRIIKLAEALEVTPSYLMGWDEENSEFNTNPHQEYSDDDEINEYLEELHKRPEMKTLFSVAKGVSKEDLEKAVKIIEMFKDNK